MKITKENIIVGDLETLKGYFLSSYYIPNTGEWLDFSVNKYRNDLPALLKFLEENKDDKYYIYYNGIGFDMQIIEYIWKHQDKLLQMGNLEFAEKIWQVAQDTIETTRHGGYLPFREEFFNFKCIDPLKIQHFDNKNRMVGLKRLEFEMDAPIIEEMGVPHTKVDFTEDECKELVEYCHNDIRELYHNYLYLTGECENMLYKGTNQIELREQLTNTFGINCLNYSNSKYGDEIMKKVYAETEGIVVDKLPKRGTFRKSLDLGKCIPKYVKFQTESLNKLLIELKTKTIPVKSDMERTIQVGSRKHTFALGGLHSKTENEWFEATDDVELIDIDVRGYYVWSMICHKIAPKHLNTSSFLKTVKWLYEERSKLKDLVKAHPEYKALVAGYKEAAVSIEIKILKI